MTGWIVGGSAIKYLCLKLAYSGNVFWKAAVTDCRKISQQVKGVGNGPVKCFCWLLSDSISLDTVSENKMLSLCWWGSD